MNRLIVLNFVVALALVACGDSSAPGTTTGEECSDNADCIDGICIDGECLVGEADTGDDPLDDPTLDSNEDPSEDTLADTDVEEDPGVDADADAGCEPGTFQCPCEANTDCDSGYCIDTSGGRFCTTLCVDACPDEWECRLIQSGGADLVQICVP
ncbi:MAG: hypothetical protein ACJAYU_004737, partial [Bradymonadia bacterium]